MKPNEHEYKVMGLAPYGKDKYSQKALAIFKSTLYVDGIKFKWKINSGFACEGSQPRFGKRERRYARADW